MQESRHMREKRVARRVSSWHQLALSASLRPEATLLRVKVPAQPNPAERK